MFKPGDKVVTNKYNMPAIWENPPEIFEVLSTVQYGKFITLKYNPINGKGSGPNREHCFYAEYFELYSPHGCQR